MSYIINKESYHKIAYQSYTLIIHSRFPSHVIHTPFHHKTKAVRTNVGHPAVRLIHAVTVNSWR